MANSFTSTPRLYILAYALFISNLIPFCEQHHNSYHGKCTVYNLRHVNAKVIISLQIKVLPQKKMLCGFLMVMQLLHRMNITVALLRDVPAVYSC